MKVLDHGYVELVESWGSDERVIEAARMSVQGGFVSWEPYENHPKGDAGLLAYMWKNKHAAPLEMAGMTIEVQAPIFVFREWHRHRTQCLTGDTMIACVSPSGSTYKRSIKSICDLKHGGVEDSLPRTGNGYSKAGNPVTRKARRKVPWRTRVLPNCQQRILRVLNEETLEFDVAPMREVWEAGVKTVYLLTTSTGRTIKASAEHPFFCRHRGEHTTGFGFEKLKHLKVGWEIARMGKVPAHDRVVPPALRVGIGVWTTMMRARVLRSVHDTCYLCEKGFNVEDLQLDHVVPVAENLLRALDVTNLKPICKRCHRNKTNAEQPSREGMTKRGVRWERVVSVKKLGKEMTYDIEVEGPHHNYVANDLVVHNSYNEMSARYTPLPDVNYVPTVERLMMSGGANKQAQGMGTQLTVESAERYRHALETAYTDAEALYKEALAAGVPKELARVHLPVGRYSRMMASTDLRNWLAFLTLRMAPNAQWEIQQYAHAVHGLLVTAFPRTLELFDER